MATQQVKIDVPKLAGDVALRGWLRNDLARAAGVSAPTVTRALTTGAATPRTLQKMALALGYTVKRYLLLDAA